MKWKTSNAPKSSVSRAQRRCKSESRSIIIARLYKAIHKLSTFNSAHMFCKYPVMTNITEITFTPQSKYIIYYIFTDDENRTD